MIKNLALQQEASKHKFFSKRLSTFISMRDIDLSPNEIARLINQYHKKELVKPHAVRKWLIGETMPKGETLLNVANWLNIDPNELLERGIGSSGKSNRVCFEFDFTDQEVISKYLSMTVKQKMTVRLLIDAIADK